MPATELLDFTGKNVVVCGASDGIGYGVAKMFLKLGAKVFATGTKPASEYDNDFTGFEFHTLNLKDKNDISNFSKKFDRVDVLVNCIGNVLWGKLEFEREGFEKIININLIGAMQLCNDFYPLLEASGGCIVNMDSITSIRVAPTNPAYCSSKAGMVMMTKVLASRWGQKGVRVNTVSPGIVPTKLTKNQTSPENEEVFKKRNPIPRFGTPQDLASAVVFLASPMASYITGHQLVVDGGASL